MDQSFGTGGTVAVNFGGDEEDGDLALQPDGKIVIVGDTTAHGTPDFAVARVQGDPVFGGGGPGGPGGGQAMPDGRLPEPGGWNRFQLEVADLAATVERLREQGTQFRNAIVDGVGGRQIVIDDPSGNPIELFQPKTEEARLSPASM
ncbi:MAG: VOC family protein [Actinomycetota bacterium]|nr:VOC family protein [Actinomycetota bacterium]